MRRNNHAYIMALGGVLAALAVVIMCLGGLIPLATFVCPMLCILILSIFLMQCSKRTGFAWYVVVALLSVLLGPDKEASAVFLFLGYYPILKPELDRFKIRILLKILLFNAAILLMYYLLLNLFGLEQIAQEYEELGITMTIVLLILGNVTFFLLDKLLERLPQKFKKVGKKPGHG